MSESKKQLSVIFVSGNYLVTLRQLRQNYGEVRFNFVLEKIVLYTYVYIYNYTYIIFSPAELLDVNQTSSLLWNYIS